jgi:tetratricopeptide (TPR) repeat protein
VLISILPYHTKSLGIRIPSDGLGIIKLPFQNTSQIIDKLNNYDLFEAIEYFYQKNYDKSIEILENNTEKLKNNILIKHNLSLMYLKKGFYAKSFELLNNIVDSIEEKKNSPYKAIVYNSLAWNSLIQQDIDNADKYSKIAYHLDPDNRNFKGTRGSVFIELGIFDKGLFLLKGLVDFKYPNYQSLCAAIYLCLGYYLINNVKESKMYYEFVESYLSNLDKEVFDLWAQIKKRINY